MTDSLGALQAALAGRYTIVRELGRGGNAVVYLAHDVRHDRKVAIKVLQPDLALGVRTERFLREIQLAARLTHPNILMLHESGELNGIPYYVMPYVAGESLRARLDKQKRLPVDEALRITYDVAAALVHAHAQGIIHRDIKPENILLEDGRAVVADFGIARALSEGQGGAVTQTGTVVGSPLYMSPEQGGGVPGLDGRSDLYSLGCVLYEMLAGHPPFMGQNTQELIARHAIDPVPSLRAARSAVSEGLERVIRQALAKQPEDRFVSVAAFIQALAVGGGEHVPRRRWLPWWIATAAMAVMVVALALRGRDADAPSIAVLPCENLSTDPENEYFSQGMAEELISGLSRVPGLRVAALTSSLALKGKPLSVRQIGETLKVTNVLTCSVRHHGGRLRMGARLVRAADGSQLWGETYDRDGGVRDVIAVQEDIARAIVRALPAQLALPTTPLAGRRSTDSVAYDLYLRASKFLNERDREANEKAISYLEEAIVRDSMFALAHSGLAQAYRGAANLNYLPRALAYRNARAAATRAVAIDDGLAEAHGALGFVHFSADWNWKAAEEEYRKAIKLNPNLSTAHAGLALLLAILGRHREAVSHAAEARGLDPLSTTTAIGSAFMVAREPDRAVADLQRVVDLSPNFSAGHSLLGRALLNAGRFDEAVRVLEKSNSFQRGNTPVDRGALGLAYARAGRNDKAREILSRLLEQPGAGSAAGAIAFVYLGLGENDKVVEAAVAAVEAQEVNPLYVADPLWDPVRSDPRFKAMRKKVGLDP